MGNRILYIISAVFMMGVAVFCAIAWLGWGYGGYYASNFAIMFFVIVSFIFASFCPLLPIPNVNEHFPFFMHDIWRPCFMIVVGLIYFPDFWDNGHWHQTQWFWFLRSVFAIGVVIMGIVELIFGLIQCCGGSSGSSGTTSSSTKVKSSGRAVY